MPGETVFILRRGLELYLCNGRVVHSIVVSSTYGTRRYHVLGAAGVVHVPINVDVLLKTDMI